MNNQTIKRIFKYLKKDLFSIILTLMLAVASVSLTIYVPILFGDAIDCIIEKDNVLFESLKLILVKIIFIIITIGILQWLMMILNNKEIEK